VWLVRAATESERLNQTRPEPKDFFRAFFEGKNIIFIVNILPEKFYTKIINNSYNY